MRPIFVILSTLATLLSLPLIRRAYLDYQGWYNLGAGGLPHNIFGWIIQCTLRLFASRDTKSTACYESGRNVSELEKRSYFKAGEEISQRKGKAPETGAWVAPHRQLSMTGSRKLVEVKRPSDLAGLSSVLS